MKFTSIVFDLDGTLINTLEDLMNSVNVAMRHYGFPEKNIDEVCSFVGNGVKRLVYLSVPEGTSEEIKENCLKIFKEDYTKNSRVKTCPYDGIVSVLETLKKSGIKTCVVTNKMQEAAVDVVRYYFGDNISTIIGQIDGVAQKPAPDGVLLAMKEIGADPQKTVYVGDSEVDCQTAHNSGLPILGCTWGFRGRKVLEEYGAEYIIDHPEQILDFV